MTGHYHNSTGVWHTIGGRSLLRQDEWSLATAFGEAGYATGLFGKWHLGDNYPYRPQDRGFQEVVTHGGGGVGNTPDYWGNKYNDDHYRGERRVGSPLRATAPTSGSTRRCGFIDAHRERRSPFSALSPPTPRTRPTSSTTRYSDPYLGQVETPGPGRVLRHDHLHRREPGRAARSSSTSGAWTENTIFIFMTDNGTAGGATLDEGPVHRRAATTPGCAASRARSTRAGTACRSLSTGRRAGMDARARHPRADGQRGHDAHPAGAVRRRSRRAHLRRQEPGRRCCTRRGRETGRTGSWSPTRSASPARSSGARARP